MAVSRTSHINHRRWFWRLTLLSIATAIAIGVVLMQFLQVSSIAKLRSTIDIYQPVLAGLRLSIIAAIGYAWPKLVQHAQRSGRVTIVVAEQLSALRWRIVAWLLAIELLLGQNLIGHLMQALHWTGL